MGEHQAKCTVEVFALIDVDFDIEPILEYWTDKGMNDNTSECGGVAAKK